MVFRSYLFSLLVCSFVISEIKGDENGDSVISEMKGIENGGTRVFDKSVLRLRNEGCFTFDKSVLKTIRQRGFTIKNNPFVEINVDLKET